jgi:hypothetical protein
MDLWTYFAKYNLVFCIRYQKSSNTKFLLSIAVNLRYLTKTIGPHIVLIQILV